MVIASIHQPSTDSLLKFDKVLLLSKGITFYHGPPKDVVSYFSALGFPSPPMLSPAEFMLELTNTDFSRDDDVESRFSTLAEAWETSLQRKLTHNEISHERAAIEEKFEVHSLSDNILTNLTYPRTTLMQVWIQLHRMMIVL